VTDLDEEDAYEPRLSTGPTRPTSRVFDEILDDDDSPDEPSDRHEKHPRKRPLTQGGIESKRNRPDSELELGTKMSAAAELPSKPSGSHSARVAQPASSQERVHPRFAGMKNQNFSHASEYISPTA
jgi:hypothetical protein